MSTPRASSLSIRTTLMQNLPRMDIVVIKNYYQMTTMNENVNWMKLTMYTLFNFSSPPAPFCTSTFTLNNSKKLNVYTREK